MRLISFGGVTLPATQGQNDLNAVGRSGLVSLPGGAFDMDGAELVPQANTLSKTFLYQEGDGIDASVDALLSMCSRGRRILRMRLRDESTERQTWAKMVQFNYRRGMDQLNNQPVSITWERNYPYWLASADEPTYLDDGEALDDGWTLDDANSTAEPVGPWLGLAAYTLTINNTGGARIPKLLIRVIVVVDSISNLRFTNPQTGQWILYSGTLAAGQVLEIDTLTKTATIDGVDVYDDMVIGPDQVDWLELAIGNNALELTFDPLMGIMTSFVPRVYWSRHYL